MHQYWLRGPSDSTTLAWIIYPPHQLVDFSRFLTSWDVILIYTDPSVTGSAFRPTPRKVTTHAELMDIVFVYVVGMVITVTVSQISFTLVRSHISIKSSKICNSCVMWLYIFISDCYISTQMIFFYISCVNCKNNSVEKSYLSSCARGFCYSMFGYLILIFNSPT